MGCSFSGLKSLNGAINAGDGEVWVNDARFRILKKLGDPSLISSSSSAVFLVKEVPLPDAPSGLDKKKGIDPSHISADGTYALKKVLIQSEQQLELVRQEIRVSSQFNHPNLLPLLDHAIISIKGKEEGSQNHEAYFLFPVHLDGTLTDITKILHSKTEFFSTIQVLQIFRQLCAGLKHMHNYDPPHAHNDVKPDNILITHHKGQPPLAILMDFESARPSRRAIRTQSEAVELQEWASEHCSALYRAPELWKCPSQIDIDERTDVWSLGCTLYAIMYGKSPFEYEIDESEGDLQSIIMNAQIKWASGPETPYPEPLRQFITWMLQPQLSIRPHVNDIMIHVDKLIAKYST